MGLKKNLLLRYSILIVSVCIFYSSYGQVSGCKDPAANNYNPSATLNDGSCTYNSTTYNPPVKVDPLSSTLVETSGLQMAGNYLWSFNDGGNAAAIYRVDTVTGNVLQTVNLGGATNVDWEDIAFDGTYLYVGDFGNNGNGARTDLKIYKFQLASIPDYTTNPVTTISSTDIEVINFTYADQVPVVPTAANNTKFDCEAMIVEGGVIHLFSKNWIDLNTTHYTINSIVAGTYIAAPIETLATGYLVTAADKVSGKNIIVLLGYESGGIYNHFMHVLSDFSAGFYFNGNKRKLNVSNVFTMGQAEGITFRNSTYGYISNEQVSPLSIPPRLRSFNIANFLPPYLQILPLDLVDFNVINMSGKHNINWKFAAPVNNFQVLFSDNGRTFNSITAMDQTEKGSFNYTPSSLQNCYKISWQQNDGSNKYSNTICLSNAAKEDLYNIVLHTNGQLQLLSSVADNCLFRIVSTDGRVLAQSTGVSLIAGSNSIRFGKQLTLGSLVVLQIIGNKDQRSVLLKVSN